MKVVAKVLGNTAYYESEELTIEKVDDHETRFTFKTAQPDINYYFLGMTYTNNGDDSYSKFAVGMQIMNKSQTSFQIFEASRSDYYLRSNFIIFRIDEGEDDIIPSEILYFDGSEIKYNSEGFTGEFSLENNNYDLILKTNKNYQNRIFITQTSADLRPGVSVRQIYFEEDQVRLELGYRGMEKWDKDIDDKVGVFIFVYDTDKYFNLPLKEIKSIYDSKKDINIEEEYVTAIDNYATGKYKITLSQDITDDLLVFCDLDADLTYTERSSTIDFSRTGNEIGANEFDVFIYNSRGTYAHTNWYFSLKFINNKET